MAPLRPLRRGAGWSQFVRFDDALLQSTGIAIELSGEMDQCDNLP